MDIPQEHKEVLVAMGVALLILQTTERVIRLCMTLVLPKDGALTLESLQQQEESERYKTLGYFLAELRKRVNIDAEFDLLLRDFLKNRNDFIHDLSRVRDWGFKKAQDVASSKEFVNRIIRQSERVTKVFSGFIRAWQEQIGMDLPVPEHEFFDDIERNFRPIVGHIFFTKDT